MHIHIDDIVTKYILYFLNLLFSVATRSLLYAYHVTALIL